MLQNYDVIVVGGGHAGCEAAAAAANLGSSTLLITMNMNTIAQMSCNPAMGGVAKGQIVREIDAMGGYSGIITDKTMIQFRMLNRSKGPAMWSPRAQSDRMRFAEEWRITLESLPKLDFWQDMVSELVIENEQVVGVKTQIGVEFRGKSVVLTNGTFLNGLIHLGEKQFGGGRAAERAATGITEQLQSVGFQSGRMKTGTPPRVDGRSLDYSKMVAQDGDENPGKFSFTDTPQLKDQRPCYITYTNPKVHDILREGFEKSPMFTGRIKGLGPRYCPSVEDKINRFADRERHQIFVEPEGWNTCEIYVNGFSTSLPEDIQIKAMREIEGFENVKMFRPGYAIEYDYFPPTQLYNTLETKAIKKLYFAGQINGTTGYEEAGGQGLMAGINAHLNINGKDPFILGRADSYIGVLIDDLVTKGTDEPYRMFTSRAEYRILLRQDNADIRLTEKSHRIGLASDERLQAVEKKIEKTQSIINFFNKANISPEELNAELEELGSAGLKQTVKLHSVITRPNIGIENIRKNSYKLQKFVDGLDGEVDEYLEQAEILMKYDGYIEKQVEHADKMQRLEDVKLHTDIEYHRLVNLSKEARTKLTNIQPTTLGQASRISGVSPADISVLMIYMGR